MNDVLTRWLESIFQKRNEPNFAWTKTVAANLLLPCLRGYWSMSSVDENGAVYDLSGQGRTLTNNRGATFGLDDLAVYADLVAASTHYFSRPDEAGLDITGALTIGGWFRFDAPSIGSATGLLSKYGAAGQRAYDLHKIAGNTARFLVSVDGTAITQVTSTVVCAAGQWYFIAGRFTPSTEMAVFVNGTWNTNVAAIPASIFNSNASLTIGTRNVPFADYFDGQCGGAFLCAAAVPNMMIQAHYDQVRTKFNV